MINLLAIADPSDALLLHADPACDGLHALVDQAERLLGEPLAAVESIVETAAMLGLLVEVAVAVGVADGPVGGTGGGTTAGERWCGRCRHTTREGAHHTRRAVHALAA